jgi:hypothetical protein
MTKLQNLGFPLIFFLLKYLKRTNKIRLVAFWVIFFTLIHANFFRHAKKKKSHAKLNF